MSLKVSSAKWQSFCLGLNVLKGSQFIIDSQVSVGPGNGLALRPFLEYMMIRSINVMPYIDRLVQERRNSSTSGMKLLLSCINPSIWSQVPYTISLLAHKCQWYLYFIIISMISIGQWLKCSHLHIDMTFYHFLQVTYITPIISINNCCNPNKYLVVTQSWQHEQGIQDINTNNSFVWEGSYHGDHISCAR